MIKCISNSKEEEIVRKALVFLNGKEEINKKELTIFLEDSEIYCSDGGANCAYHLSLRPKLILGDMDSINNDVKEYYESLGVKFEFYPRSKDKSDGEILIDKISKKYERIYIINGRGGRLDQEFANISLLEKYTNCSLISSGEESFLLEDKTLFINEVGKRVSIISIEEKSIIERLKGFEYEKENFILNRGSTLCISNIIKNNRAEIILKKGKIIVIKEI